MKTSKNFWLIIISIVVVAGLGSLFVNFGMEWFNGLTKPDQWLPNIVIPIVWTIIYLLTAVVVIKLDGKNMLTKTSKILLFLNGIFNIMWCLIFFTLNQTFGGEIIIIINAILGFALVAELLKTNKLYGLLMSIYPVWLSVATMLNTALWILN